MPSIILQLFDRDGIEECQCSLFNFDTYIGLIDFVSVYDFNLLFEKTKISSLKMYDYYTNELILIYCTNEVIPEFNSTYFRSLDKYIEDDNLRGSLFLPTYANKKIGVLTYSITISEVEIQHPTVFHVCRDTVIRGETLNQLSSIISFQTSYSDSNGIRFFRTYTEKDYL